MIVADKSTTLVLTGTGDVLGARSTAWRRSGRAAIMRLPPRRARWRTPTWTPRRLPAAPCRSPARSASTPIRQRDRGGPRCRPLMLPTSRSRKTWLPQQAPKARRRSPPWETVSELDRYIIGQHDAKRAVAIALAQPLAPPAAQGSDARGGAAQEHPDDRPDRRRQDRDLAAPGEARAVRRSSRSRRPSSPRSAMSAATWSRSSATWSRSASASSREEKRREVEAQAHTCRRRSGCSTRWSASMRSPTTRDSFRKRLEGRRARRQGDRGAGQATPPTRWARSRCPACPAPRSA